MGNSAARAAAFYREAIAAGTVWTVRDVNGIPAPENADGERAMPFWSSEGRLTAVRANVDAYRGFDVVAIPLDEWQGRWLPGLRRDGLLVGLNWSGPRATGYDAAPDEVLASLAALA